LTEIAEILDAGTPERIRAAIERHRLRVTTEVTRLSGIAAQLGTVLDDAEPAGPVLVYERWRGASTVARIVVHTTQRGLAGMLGPGYAELSARLGAQGVPVTGPGGCRYLGEDPELAIELYVPVGRRPRPEGRMTAGELPATLLAATLHHGPYTAIDAAYRALGRWVGEHGRTLRGPAEEAYLVPPGPGVPPAALRTEVAWPIDSGERT
jgi:effector-binding domain-containing protein